jgi:putative transferase (TIGR04331 family)
MVNDRAMSNKIVILGEIPDDFNPDKYIAFAPYCFINREHIYPNFESLILEPDPFSPTELAEVDNLSVNYCLLKVKEIGERLNHEHNKSYSSQVWSVLLNPWLIYLIQNALEKEKRVKNFINRYKEEKLIIKVLEDDIEWKFENSLDFFINGCLSVSFSEWLTSRIIECNVPKNWELSYYSRNIKKKVLSTKKSMRSWISNLIFSRCNHVYGFSVLDKLLFSSLGNLKRKKVEYIHFDDLIEKKENVKWSFNFDKVLIVTQPVNIVDFDIRVKNRNRGKIRIISASDLFYFDEDKRKVAEALLNEEYIINTQHGGHNYGSANIHGFLDLLEYFFFQRFVTWGWEHKMSNFKCRVVALPSPYLTRFKDKYKHSNGKIILVSNRATLSFRFDSLPQVYQWLRYRKSKINLFDYLYSKPELWENFYYRPYFTESDSFIDKSFFLNKYPTVKILQGNLHEKLLRCKLVILDHPGTTLNICLSANIPTICFWEKEHFIFNIESEILFNILSKNQMLFFSTEELINFIDNNESKISEWWNSTIVQNARKLWCESFARTDKKWKFEWMKKIINS